MRSSEVLMLLGLLPKIIHVAKTINFLSYSTQETYKLRAEFPEFLNTF